MKTMAETFWDVVEQMKGESGPFEPIRNPFNPLNSQFHPLRSPFHPLNSPFNPLNNPFNPHRGSERTQMLRELLEEYVD